MNTWIRSKILISTILTSELGATYDQSTDYWYSSEEESLVPLANLASTYIQFIKQSLLVFCFWRLTPSAPKD